MKVSIQKYFVSLLYISVAIKASLLKFSMFSVHKNTVSNISLDFFLTLKLLIWYRLPFYIFAVASSGWGKGVDPKLFVSSCTGWVEGIDPKLFASSCTRYGEDLGKCFIENGREVNVLQTSLVFIKFWFWIIRVGKSDDQDINLVWPYG